MFHRRPLEQYVTYSNIIDDQKNYGEIESVIVLRGIKSQDEDIEEITNTFPNAKIRVVSVPSTNDKYDRGFDCWFDLKTADLTIRTGGEVKNGKETYSFFYKICDLFAAAFSLIQQKLASNKKKPDNALPFKDKEDKNFEDPDENRPTISYIHGGAGIA